MDKIDSIFDNYVPLETSRFFLRNVKDDDYNSIYQIYSDEEAVKYQGTGPMTTILQAKKTIEVINNGFKNKKFVRWGIASKDTDQLLGFVTLHTFDLANSKAEIGYMLCREYWNRYIMTEAASEVIKYAFNEGGLNRIEACIHPENAASIRLCEKLGFKKEGIKKEACYNRSTDEFEDRLIFGLLSERLKK